MLLLLKLLMSYDFFLSFEFVPKPRYEFVSYSFEFKSSNLKGFFQIEYNQDDY